MLHAPSTLSIYCYKTVDVQCRRGTATRTCFKQNKFFRIVQFFKNLQNCPVLQVLLIMTCLIVMMYKFLPGRAGRFQCPGRNKLFEQECKLNAGRIFAFQHRFGMLPTANNRANDSNTARLDNQYEYHHIFTTFACHKLPEDLV
jgi:hypothetical protein